MGGVLGFRSSPPKAVVRPADRKDVITAVKWASAHEWRVSVKASGTHPGGWGLAGDLLIDLRHMRNVTVGDGVIEVGAGATWADVYDATDKAGLNVNGGSLPDSVASTVLSGGVGFWGYAHGLVADGVLTADIVTPDGETLFASSSTKAKDDGIVPADQLWNLRGGFPIGIITKMEIKTYPKSALIAGKLHCVQLHQNSSKLLDQLVPAISAMDAGVHVKASSAKSSMWIHFLADSPQALDPLMKIHQIQHHCSLVDVEGQRSMQGGSEMQMQLRSDMRYHVKFASALPRSIAPTLGRHPTQMQNGPQGRSPDGYFHGDSRGVLTAQPRQAAKHVEAVLVQAEANAQFTSIEVWPVRASPKDRVGHAFTHSDATLLITVRCSMAGLCPVLWMELEPVTMGLYVQDESTTLPGDAVRLYGGSYRSAKCMASHIPRFGATVVNSPLQPTAQRDFTDLASEAGLRLGCNAPFLKFGPCDQPHGGTVLVVGVDSLGFNAARLLAQEGLTVILAAESGAKCLEAAQKVYVDTGRSPSCRTVDLQNTRSIEKLVAKLNTPLDAVILAADQAPDGVQVEVANNPDGAVRTASGQLYMATLIVEGNHLLTHGRLVFVTSRTGFQRAEPHLLDLFSETKTYGETFVGAQVVTAFGAKAIQTIYPHVGVALSVTPPVKTDSVHKVLASGMLDQELKMELSTAPADEAALLAAGSSLIRALVPGKSFCYDGCGQLDCQLPTDGVCAVWSGLASYAPVAQMDSCSSGTRALFVYKAAKDGLAGSISMLLCLIVMLPLYNVIAIRKNDSKDEGFLQTVSGIADHSGVATFYHGLRSAVMLSPLMRFGDTFAHGLAVGLFGQTTLIGIVASAFLTCSIYSLWRVVVGLLVAADFNQPQGLKSLDFTAKGDSLRRIQLQKIIQTTFLGSMPFWLGVDSVLLFCSMYAKNHIVDITTFELVSYAAAGAMAGFVACLVSTRGTDLAERLPVSTFEGGLFVFLWKLLLW